MNPRQALRNELRALLNAPGLDPALKAAALQAMNGKLISNLTRDEMRGAFEALGRVSRPFTAPTTPDDDDDDEETDTMPADADTDAEDEAAAIEREMGDVRATIANGGFAALDSKLRELITASRKPPVIVHVPVEAPAPGSAPAVPQASPTGGAITWGEAFGVQGSLASETSLVWDGAHPDTPRIDPSYVWPAETVVALTQIKRKENVFLWGPPGVGKTEFCTQLAARLRRPFVLISCDEGTDAATIVGMTVPHNGSVTFQPGQLVKAIQTPGAVICIDEMSVARPGALFAFQNVLTPSRTLYVQETGQRIKAARGIIFFGCDNTNGTGGGTRHGYHATKAINTATMNRFGTRIRLSWPDQRTEAGIVTARVPGCTPELARLLVKAATTTRQAAAGQQITQGIGLRSLFSWAALLVDGIPADLAFTCAVGNTVPEEEQEALRQQCILTIDPATIARALNRETEPVAPLTGAAADFEPVSFGRI